MQDQKTEVYESMDIGDPVDTLDDLPADADEGHSRYVKAENAIYSMRAGAWVKEIYQKKDA